MPKKDWNEIKNTIESISPMLFDSFLKSDELFLPNPSMRNPFAENEENFSAKQLNKTRPGTWIPLYSSKSLPTFFLKNNITPIRSGKAAFFFYKGGIFFDLNKVIYTKIPVTQCKAITTFIPLTLRSNFERNENAYLNKAVAMGIVNHFVAGNNYSIFNKEITNKTNHRLLYGQFGKIKLTAPILFSTTSANKTIAPGFQFEIDLVLENEKEIIIFEAKMGVKAQTDFSLLQLYYPLIYFRKLTGKSKQIRTIFIDIIHTKNIEEYRLVEFIFKNGRFDDRIMGNAFCYTHQTPSLLDDKYTCPPRLSINTLQKRTRS